MTGEIQSPADLRLAWQPMNRDQAAEATNRVNAYAKRLPQVVKEAFDGRAWEALGYESWDDYVDDALVITRRYANMLLAAAVNLELLAEMFDVDVDLFGLPERVLRGIDAGTMVPAISEALAELTEDVTDGDRVEVIESTVRTETKKVTKTKQEAKAATEGIAAARARREAEAQKPPEPEPVACSVTDCPDHAIGDLGFCPWHHGKFLADVERDAAAKKPVPDEEPPPSSDEPQQDPAPAAAHDPGKAGAPESRAAATGSTGASSPGAGDGGGTGDVLPTPPAETLPADWRDLIGHATYLLRLDAAQVAAAATADDDADLCALTEWCFQYVQAKEQNA